MITLLQGNLLEDDAQALVNTVNCVGVMGRGIALQFKRAFPDNFAQYKRACDSEELAPGKMFITKSSSLGFPQYLINFPTKRHWKGKSRLSDVELGLVDLADQIRELNIKSIAIPPLGSGLGGLNWADVKAKIYEALGAMDVDIRIYEPMDAAAPKPATREAEPPKMTEGRAILVRLMDRYLKGFLDPFVTLLEVQKLMYFMQVSDQDLRLNFQKAPYGPYADNLRHVLHKIEGYFLTGYHDGGDQPNKTLEVVPGAVQDATQVLEGNRQALERLERVSELVDGFESPFGVELLASVHWVVHQGGAKSLDQVIAAIGNWNQRKKANFSPAKSSGPMITSAPRGGFNPFLI